MSEQSYGIKYKTLTDVSVNFIVLFFLILERKLSLSKKKALSISKSPKKFGLYWVKEGSVN